MKPATILAELRNRGIQLSLSGEDLVYRAPKGSITDDLLAAVKSNKTFIVKKLKAENASHSEFENLARILELDDSNDDGNIHSYARYVEPVKSRLLARVGLDVNYLRGEGCFLYGEDGKPYKTRSVDTVGLEGLLDEAESRAYDVVAANDEAKPQGWELDEPSRRHIARVVGIAALKYADLSQNRESDYVFSYDKMLALTGNTATYMQYSYARVFGIFAKGNVDATSIRNSDAKIRLDEPAERQLGLKLLQFGDALNEVLVDYRPNQLTNYLFELAKSFSAFFEQCPVLKAEEEATKNSRLLLCDLTARTLKQGLALLGIDVVQKM